MATDGNFTAESAAQHQAELNDYLQSKNINQLFIQIVESLLIEKPDNPIGFIVEFLAKKYPDLAGGAAPTSSAAAARAEEDEDEDDTEDEAEAPDATRSGSFRKRGAVCAESGKQGLEDLTEIPKTEAERARILEILEHTVLCRHLEPEQKEFVARAMFKVEHKAGDVIIRQGDTGDNFYVLESGSVACTQWEAGDESTEKHLLTYAPGAGFGELALMYDAPRAATCTASSEVQLFALDRKAFKVIMVKTNNEKRSQTKIFLQNVEILKQLSEYEFFTMADAIKEVSFAAGEVVFRQGEAGQDFFIVKQGSVVCSQADARGEAVETARLTSGDYFGEIALLTTEPRCATVSADGALKLLSLDRATFTRVLGPIEAILRRNMQAYNKFTSQNMI